MTLTDEESRLLFLYSGSCNVLPSSCAKLRSYLNCHLLNVAGHQNSELLKSFRSRNKTCPYCYSPWNIDAMSFKLLPSKRCKRQIQNKDSESDKPQLNESRNTLVLKCKICTKKSSFSLIKRRLVEEKVQEKNVEVKKKKKKKDKSCGLFVNKLKPSEKPKLEFFNENKKKRSEDSKSESVQNIQPGSQKPSSILKCNSSKITSKKIAPNPYAIQLAHSKKKDKNLQKLKQAVKQEKNLAKKSLKDFLTLV